MITTCNRREYVLEAIRSVMAQTYPAAEIIVVVDGSTDDTAAAVCHTFPDVVLCEQRNLGPSIAHNTGIAAATYEWVCFLDDDDLWHPDKLCFAAAYIRAHSDCKALRNPVWFFAETADGPQKQYGYDRDFVAGTLAECCRAVENGDTSSNSTGYLDIEGDSFRLLLEQNRGVLSSSVIERETLIRAGCFSPSQQCGDDWTLFLNVARLCEWHTLPQRLGFSRLHTRQNTSDAANGLWTLCGIVNAWYTGRPLIGKTKGLEFLPTLAGYGIPYREAVQHYLWKALRHHEFGLSLRIRTAGWLLLPRLRDRLYTLLPPPLTWRIERLRPVARKRNRLV